MRASYAGLEPVRIREFASTLRSAAHGQDEIRTTTLRALVLADLDDHANLLGRLADRADLLSSVAIELEGRAALAEHFAFSGLPLPANLFMRGLDSVTIASAPSTETLPSRLIGSVAHLEAELAEASRLGLPWSAQQAIHNRIAEARAQLDGLLADAEAEHTRLRKLQAEQPPFDPAEMHRLRAAVAGLEEELSEESGPTVRAGGLKTLLAEARADLNFAITPAVSAEELAAAANAAGVARFSVHAAAPEEWVQPDPIIIAPETPLEMAQLRQIERNALIFSVAQGMIYGPPGASQIHQAAVIVEVNEGNYTRYNQLDEAIRADVNVQFGGSPNCASEVTTDGALMVLSEEGTACGVYVLEHGDGFGQNTINAVGGWSNGVLYDMPRRYSPGFGKNVDWSAAETQVGGVAGSISAIPANVASGGWLPVGASAFAATDDCIVGETEGLSCGLSIVAASVNVASLGSATGFGRMLASELDDEVGIALAKNQGAAYVETYALMPNSVVSVLGSEFRVTDLEGRVSDPNIEIGVLP